MDRHCWPCATHHFGPGAPSSPASRRRCSNDAAPAHPGWRVWGPMALEVSPGKNSQLRPSCGWKTRETVGKKSENCGKCRRQWSTSRKLLGKIRKVVECCGTIWRKNLVHAGKHWHLVSWIPILSIQFPWNPMISLVLHWFTMKSHEEPLLDLNHHEKSH